MNDGKICVSICAETADELIKKIRLAAKSADVVEIRFDCLKEDQFHFGMSALVSKVPILVTYRPQEQGGKIDADLTRRELFWQLFINILNDKRKFWFDFEYDLPPQTKVSNPVTIRSFHDFAGVPENLENVYQNLSRQNEIPKIAVQTQDITDTILIWKLLKRAKSENKEIIPIAMGEAGKWTRILGLAHGAFMTYASLDSLSETAPGQVSAQDLIEVYRAKELDENSGIYGILGSNTSVSMSPYIHNEAFKFHQLNSVFVPLQVQNLDEFMRRMVKPESREIELNFKGFAVTLPHKQEIIKHLDYLDESAQKIGAVNTVKIEDGKLYGYNTDAHGFIEPLLQTYGDLRAARVAVLGAGGAARACIYALKKSGAEVTLYARDLGKTKALAEEFGVGLKLLDTADSAVNDYRDFDILVNTTPLGMKNKAEDETPAFAGQLKGLQLVYDLVYTPFQTKLMQEADIAEIPKIGGLAMLIAQASEQQKIWTGLDAPVQQMSRAALKRLNL